MKMTSKIKWTWPSTPLDLFVFQTSDDYRVFLSGWHFTFNAAGFCLYFRRWMTHECFCWMEECFCPDGNAKLRYIARRCEMCTRSPKTSSATTRQQCWSTQRLQGERRELKRLQLVKKSWSKCGYDLQNLLNIACESMWRVMWYDLGLCIANGPVCW